MTWDPETATSTMRSIEAAFLIGVKDATEVWLIRHGDVYEDLAVRRAHGEPVDPGLSSIGQTQVERLGQRLKNLRIDAVYSSPLRRARETAAVLTADPVVDPRLVEVEVDTSSGRVEVIETAESAIKRMTGAVDDAVAAHKGGRVLMVGHGVAILMYLGDVLRLEFGQLRVLPYYTSVSVVRVLGERRMLGSLGDATHLAE